MADIITTGTSGYATGSIDTASTVVNNVTATDAVQPNGLAAAIIQLETILGLGTTLKGSLADLVARLAVSITSGGKLKASTALNREVFPLPVSEGGVGVTSFTADGVVLGNGATTCAVTAAGAASTVLAVASGGGAPAFSQVKTAMIATATGTATGSASFTSAEGDASCNVTTDVTMNDYSFFPSLTVTGTGSAYSGDWSAVAVADPSSTVGRVSMTGAASNGPFSSCSVTTRIRWRYITSTDNPEMWVAFNSLGQIVSAWASDDPSPNNTPGVSCSGATPLRLVSQDLEQIPYLLPLYPQAREWIESKGYSEAHIAYRALQQYDDPCSWLMRGRVENGIFIPPVS